MYQKIYITDFLCGFFLAQDDDLNSLQSVEAGARLLLKGPADGLHVLAALAD